MYRVPLLFICLSLTQLLTAGHGIAGEIEKGTYAVGTSSNAAFSVLDNENDYRLSHFRITLELGYFPIDNLEIGAALSASAADQVDGNGSHHSVTPYITYHIPLRDASNIYLGLGAGFSHHEFSPDDWHDSDSNGTVLFAEAGWEHLLTENVAVDLGFRFSRHTSEWRSNEGHSDDDTLTTYDSSLRIKLYF